jgi:hypothetical protein
MVVHDRSVHLLDIVHRNPPQYEIKRSVASSFCSVRLRFPGTAGEQKRHNEGKQKPIATNKNYGSPGIILIGLAYFLDKIAQNDEA